MHGLTIWLPHIYTYTYDKFAITADSPHPSHQLNQPTLSHTQLAVPFDLLCEATPPKHRGTLLLLMEGFWVLGSVAVVGCVPSVRACVLASIQAVEHHEAQPARHGWHHC